MSFLFDKNHEYTLYNKKEKIRIVFMIQVASFWPSIESLYEACLKDERFELKILYINESSIEKAQMESSRFFLESKNLDFEIFDEKKIIEYMPHVAIYQSPYDLSHRKPNTFSIKLRKMGIRIVYIPYGIEISDTGEARLSHFDTFVVKNSWRIYTFSEMMKLEYQKYCSNRFAVRALGIPKFDAYYNKEFKLSEEIMKKIKERKIILWKMHFPKRIYSNGTYVQVTPSMDEYLEFEKKIANYKNLFFIVMPHPMFISDSIPNDLAEAAKKLIEKLSKHENVYIDKSDDYRNSLCNADAVIIDRSALMVEVGIRNIPILYMYNKEDKEKLTPPIELLVNTYEKGTTASDMEVFIQKIINNNEFDLKPRKEIMNRCITNLDGKNGLRIKEDIFKSLINQNQQKIRIVLFATGRIFRFYLNYLNILNDNRFEIVAISDNSTTEWGECIQGITIVQPNELKYIDFDILVIMTEQYYMDIKKQLVYDLHLDDEKIIRLDYFCEKFFNKNNLIV